jgi:hypothetical protein
MGCWLSGMPSNLQQAARCSFSRAQSAALAVAALDAAVRVPELLDTD